MKKAKTPTKPNAKEGVTYTLDGRKIVFEIFDEPPAVNFTVSRTIGGIDIFEYKGVLNHKENILNTSYEIGIIVGMIVNRHKSEKGREA